HFMRGIGISPGIVIGRALLVSAKAPQSFPESLLPDEVEWEKFRQAAELAIAELQQILNGDTPFSAEEESVLDSQILFLRNSEFRAKVSDRINSLQATAIDALIGLNRQPEEDFSSANRDALNRVLKH